MSGGPVPCRSCAAPIWWAVTEPAGKAIPLNNGVSPDGNLAVWRDQSGNLRARALVLDEEPAEHERRAVAHFATCPEAKAHRRPRSPRPGWGNQ